jgi:hypothetical protein
MRGSRCDVMCVFELFFFFFPRTVFLCINTLFLTTSSTHYFFRTLLLCHALDPPCANVITCTFITHSLNQAGEVVFSAEGPCVTVNVAYRKPLCNALIRRANNAVQVLMSGSGDLCRWFAAHVHMRVCQISCRQLYFLCSSDRDLSLKPQASSQQTNKQTNFFFF